MRADNRRHVLDANVILRHLVNDSPELARKARAVFQKAAQDAITLVCDPVTLAEVVWVLESFYQIPRGQIAEELTTFLAAPEITIVDKELYLTALRLYEEAVPHFGDACACAAAMKTAEGRLISFDKKLSKVAGVNRMEAV